MRRALEYVRAFDGVISQHAQDPRLAGARRLLPRGRALRPARPAGLARRSPRRSIVARDVDAGASTPAPGCTSPRLHRRDRSRCSAGPSSAGIAVTAEVTPHHLLLTTDLLAGYDPTFKVNPPLRPAEDVEALREALADGTIDAVATDHAPHARHDKEHAFVDAAFGMLGLETALAGGQRRRWSTPGRLDWAGVAEVMSVAPGPDRRAGRPGPPAGGRRAGQPRRWSTRSARVDRRPRRLAVAVAQQPLARPDPARRRARHGPARPADRPEGSAGMTRTESVLLLVLLVLVVYALMYAGWRRRVAPAPLRRGRARARSPRAAAGSAIPAMPARRPRPRSCAPRAPTSARPPSPRGSSGSPREAWASAPAPPWPSGRAAVRWERQGAAEVHVDPERLTGVGRERGMAGKWVGQNRLVVVTWRADDGSEFATGFLPRSPRRPRSWSTPSSGTSRALQSPPRQQHP